MAGHSLYYFSFHIILKWLRKLKPAATELGFGEGDDPMAFLYRYRKTLIGREVSKACPPSSG